MRAICRWKNIAIAVGQPEIKVIAANVAAVTQENGKKEIPVGGGWFPIGSTNINPMGVGKISTLEVFKLSEGEDKWEEGTDYEVNRNDGMFFITPGGGIDTAAIAADTKKADIFLKYMTDSPELREIQAPAGAINIEGAVLYKEVKFTNPNKKGRDVYIPRCHISSSTGYPIKQSGANRDNQQIGISCLVLPPANGASSVYVRGAA